MPAELAGAVTIRRMQSEDIPAMLEIDRATGNAPHWTAQAYESCLAVAARGLQRLAWVAHSKNQILGYVVASGISVAGVSEWELETLVVAAPFQRQGIGNALASTLVGELEKSGAAALLLEVRASNQTAIRLYERARMAVIGRRRGYYSPHSGTNPEDALLMQLRFRQTGQNE